MSAPGAEPPREAAARREAAPPPDPREPATPSEPRDAAPPPDPREPATPSEPRDAAPPPEPREPASPSEPRPDLARGYARSRERADAIRAQLEPLGAHERPLGLRLAVVLAVAVAVANLVAAAAGVSGSSPAVGIVFAFVMAGFAYGLWQRSYFVILLFQALLAITIVIAALSLAFAGNLIAVLLCLFLIAVCAPIFWLLVRVMARLQVPQR